MRPAAFRARWRGARSPPQRTGSGRSGTAFSNPDPKAAVTRGPAKTAAPTHSGRPVASSQCQTRATSAFIASRSADMLEIPGSAAAITSPGTVTSSASTFVAAAYVPSSSAETSHPSSARSIVRYTLERSDAVPSGNTRRRSFARSPRRGLSTRTSRCAPSATRMEFTVDADDQDSRDGEKSTAEQHDRDRRNNVDRVNRQVDRRGGECVR